MQKSITTTTTRRRLAPRAATGLLASLIALTGAITPLTPTAHASALTAADTASAEPSPLRYHLGYTVQHGWMCYGWSGGAYRCTAHWRWQGGRLVSLNTAWLPNGLTHGVTLASVHTTARKAAKRVVQRAAAVRRWWRNTYPFGQCTWGAAALAHDNVNGLGNARDWLARARARGLPTGYTPRVGATVVFQPGVQGASWLYGHVGHVVAIGAGGSFEMEAMNDSAGWGRYSFRWVHTGAGVGFIY